MLCSAQGGPLQQACRTLVGQAKATGTQVVRKKKQAEEDARRTSRDQRLDPLDDTMQR